MDSQAFVRVSAAFSLISLGAALYSVITMAAYWLIGVYGENPLPDQIYLWALLTAGMGAVASGVSLIMYAVNRTRAQRFRVEKRWMVMAMPAPVLVAFYVLALLGIVLFGIVDLLRNPKPMF